MGLIQIEGMEFYAYHGHYPEEKISGHKFLIDLSMWTDTSKAELSDSISDALNYQTAYIIVKTCIEQSNYNLLERIARTILDTLFEKFLNLEKAMIKIRKINPPMGGQINSVSVSIEKYRD
ncbi:MAG TPA: dihydroneopterin aldolase [Bacteroidales bacterium]|jgi:dihydroneopterin aldolase|nr:dihydroneopterin aldolase [Bacteroidales bacterium]MDD4236045.1 dihydroneopterin aldolase [Bacteroidales bacterium]MDY0159934.1 dihydroneopterin aldolase [Bacteroidales bacterium]HXK82039.1 dihydroneopterin aldolase [Bacteroidales bacterium]